MSYKKYVLVRTIHSLVTLCLVISAIFFLFRLMPGDFTQMIAMRGADEEVLNTIREQWGLNDPLYVQWYTYMINLIFLDFGTSRVYRVPVWEHVKMPIFNTFILVAPAVTLNYILGGVIGTAIGRAKGKASEKFTNITLITIGSFPSFFIGIVLIIVFSQWLNLFPSSGMIPGRVISDHDTWWGPYLTRDFAHHYILPFSAIVLRYLFFPTMLMRSSVVEVTGSNFAEYQRLTGISSLRHAFHLAHHASLPLISMYPMSMIRAFGGLVLIETVFNWPGIGWLLVDGVLARDLPVVMFIFTIVAVWVILTNFIVDLLYGIVDPRITTQDASN